MFNIEQLLFFDSLRSELNAKIAKHTNEIYQANQKIVAEQESIRHLNYKVDLMETILGQLDANWLDKINNYCK